MKLPDVPGAMDAEGFDFAVPALLSTPKSACLKEETRLKQARERKKQPEKTA
jgi:hypothetical protein